MGKRVGIVAVHQTKYEESKPYFHLHDLAYEPIKEILKTSGLKFVGDGTGIDAAVGASQDHWDGYAISDKLYQDQIGGHLRPEERVRGDGAVAVFYAAMSILSGRYDTIIVLALAKESQVDGKLVESFGFEPNYTRMLGLDYVSAAALQAQNYIDKYGISPEQAALVVVKNRRNAKFNPVAQAPADIEVQDVLNSPMLSSPLRELDIKPTSEGACTLILSTEEKVKKWTSKPVWIEGVGSCYDSSFLGDRELAEPRSLTSAALQAYKMAGISNPRKEIDVFELSEYTSYQELLWAEGLGLCEKGGGAELVQSGATQIGGEIPINPSGGLLSGVPVNVAGADRVIEAALQLRGEAQGRQVEGAKVALAHGTMGPCGQFHQVIILRRGY